jgi:hypothetical protein
VAAHRDDAFRAELARGQDREEADGAVTDDCDRLAGPRFGGDGGEPAGAEHVGRREQVRDELVGGDVRGRNEGAVSERDAEQFGLPSQRPLGTRLTQALW